MVLSAGCRCHGDEFEQHGGYGEGAGPYDQIPVYKARWTATYSSYYILCQMTEIWCKGGYYFCNPAKNVLCSRQLSNGKCECGEMRGNGLIAYIKDPSQVMSTVQLKPKIVKSPKFLLRTGFFPNRSKMKLSRESSSTKIDPAM